MNKTKNYEELQREVKEAKEYASRVGESQPHFRDGSVGRLNLCKVETQIAHQRYASGDNYHWNKPLDEALSKVVQLNFDSLVLQAINLMEDKANQALVDEEGYLRERLQQVEQAKASLNE